MCLLGIVAQTAPKYHSNHGAREIDHLDDFSYAHGEGIWFKRPKGKGRIADCGFLQDYRNVANTAFMKQFLVFVLTVLATLSPVRANLGDGDERIDDSYGNVVERHLLDDGTVSILYKKDRYLYFMIFANRRSILEGYSHVKGTDLSEKEIARFLKANAAGATWSPENKGTERRFIRSDGKAEATYANLDGRPTLTVRTK